jgi:hypothetical protein
MGLRLESTTGLSVAKLDICISPLAGSTPARGPIVTGIDYLLLALAGLPASCEANDEFDHNGQGSRVIKIEGRG